MWKDAKKDPPKANIDVVFTAGFGKLKDERCFGYKDNDDSESDLWWDN